MGLLKSGVRGLRRQAPPSSGDTTVLCAWRLHRSINSARLYSLLRSQSRGWPSNAIVKISRVTQRNGVRRFDLEVNSSYSNAISQFLRSGTEAGLPHKAKGGVLVKRHRPWHHRSRGSQATNQFSDTLRCGSWNACSMTSADKRLVTAELLRSKKLDILALQETGLTSRHKGQYFKGYCTFQSIASRRNRGTALVISSTLNPQPMVCTEPDDFSTWVKIPLLDGGGAEGKDPQYVVIASVYIPPRGSPDRRSALEAIMDTSSRLSSSGTRLILLGDWNAQPLHIISEFSKLGIYIPPPLTKGIPFTFHRKGHGISHIDFALSQGVVQFPSRVHRGFYHSDHWPVLVSFRGFGKGFVQHVPPMKPTSPQIRFPSGVVPSGALDLADSGIDWGTIVPVSNFESASLPEVKSTLRRFQAAIHSACSSLGFSSSSPPSRARRKLLNGKLRYLLRRKTVLGSKLSRQPGANKSEPIWREYQSVRKQFKTETLRLERTREILLGLKIHQSLRSRSPDIIRNGWRQLHRLKSSGRRHHLSLPFLKRSATDGVGPLATSPPDVMEEFRQHFESIANVSSLETSLINGGPLSDPDRDSYWEDVASSQNLPQRDRLPDAINAAITWDETFYALSRMRNDKAPGSDSIPPEVYKTALSGYNEEGVPNPPGDFGKALLNMVNLFFHAGSFEAANEVILVPIPKQGDAQLPTNYRPIGLRLVFTKLVASIVRSRLDKYLSSAGFFSCYQNAFRSKEEAIQVVVGAHESVQRRKALGLDSWALYTDFVKAYDSCPTGAILVKLRRAGVHGRCYEFVKSLYNSVNVRVRVHGYLSAPFEYRKGVLQGDPLSTLLFNVFINDIFNGITTGRGLGLQIPCGSSSDRGWLHTPGNLFADDCQLLADSAESLLHGKVILEHWCDVWGMAASPSKCGILFFPAKVKERVSDQAHIRRTRAEMKRVSVETRTGWKFQGSRLPVVSSYKHLGVSVNWRLDLAASLRARLSGARRGLFTATPILHNPSLPIPLRITLMKACVLSLSYYGGELFGMNQKRGEAIFSTIHNPALRAIYGSSLKHRAAGSSAAMLVEAGVLHPHCFISSLKCRAMQKWRFSSTFVATLLNNTLVHRRRTWFSLGKQWLRTLDDALATVVLDEAVGAFSAAKKVLHSRFLRSSTHFSGKSASFYQSRNLFSTSPVLRKFEWTSGCSLPGLSLLHAARTGRIRSISSQVASGYLHSSWRDVCPCCLLRVDDGRRSVSHLLSLCPAFSGARRRLLHLVIEAFSGYDPSVKVSPGARALARARSREKPGNWIDAFGVSEAGSLMMAVLLGGRGDEFEETPSPPAAEAGPVRQLKSAKWVSAISRFLGTCLQSWNSRTRDINANSLECHNSEVQGLEEELYDDCLFFAFDYVEEPDPGL